MNTNKSILETLRGLWRDPGIQMENELRRDLGIDSLGMVTLLLDLEDTFGFELKESDMNPYELITVADVVRLVERYPGRRDHG